MSHMKKHQSHKDKLDESLGERRGKESSKKQSMKSRRHESEGMKKHDHHAGKKIALKAKVCKG